ncbi:MAG: GGDEF domain-containing response regulator [Polyangiales bacterium]
MLVLDDDALFRSLVRAALESEGMDVLEAAKGRIASQLLAEARPDLVIVDGLLPDTNGIRWIERVRDAGSDVPIVFVSAFYRDIGTFQRLTRELGVSRVVNKPVEPRLFGAAIRQILEEKPPREATEEELAEVADALGRMTDESIVAPLPLAAGVDYEHAHEALVAVADDATLPDTMVGKPESRPPSIHPTIEVPLSPAMEKLLYVHVLFLAEDETLVEFVQGAFHDRLVALHVVRTSDEFSAALAQRRPDVAVVALPASGVERIAKGVVALRKSPLAAAVPLLVLAERGDVGVRLWSSRLGARGVLCAPFDGPDLAAKVLGLYARSRADRPRVLFFTADEVEDDLGRAIASAGLVVERVTDGDSMIATLAALRPEVVLLGGAEGHSEWTSVIRTAEGGDQPAIVVVGDVDVRAALLAGADDVVPELADGIRVIRARAERVVGHRMASGACPLTLLPSRLPFELQLRKRAMFCRRLKVPFTVAAIRLDGLDRLQADHGRAVRDRLVVALGRLLAARFRVDDIRGRWARDTLVVAFGNASPRSLVSTLARFQDEFRALVVLGRDGIRIGTTVSIGAAAIGEAGTTLESVLRLAFARMEEAGHGGGGRVVTEGLGSAT